MRSISATLLAAQKAASAEPYVRAIADNTICGIARLDPVVADNTPNTLAQHGAGVVGDAYIVRARVAAGTIYKNHSPIGGTISAAWTSMATGKGTTCNVAAQPLGTNVALLYTDAAGTGIKIRESTDYGATYAGEAAVVTAGAAVAQLAAAYKANGDLAVAWVEAAQLRVIRRLAGVWGAVATSPTAVNSYTGLDIMHDGADWRLAVTGRENTTNRPTLWMLTFGDGFDYPAGTWSAYDIQQQAESDASVTYWSPSITHASTYRATFVEVDSFSGGATRTYRTSLVWPALFAAVGAYSWRTPAPVDYASAYGLSIAAGTDWYVECGPDIVMRASRDVDALDLSARVLAADVHESDRDLAGYVDFDNTDAALAGPPAPLVVGNTIALGWGYKTTAGSERSDMAEAEIARLEYRRTGGVSVLRVHLGSGWSRLRRDRQRTSIYHAAATLTYGQIIQRAMFRAGLTVAFNSASTRQGAIKPAFQIAPQTPGYDAVRQALSFLADRLILRAGNVAYLIEPLTSDTSDYTFGDQHGIYDSEIALESPPVSEAFAFGAATFGEAIDYAAAAQLLATRAQRRDLTSTTPAAAAATAAAHLRQLQLDQPGGRLVVPPCCGLEVLDVIDIADNYISPDPVLRRVRALRWRYDVMSGRYDQTIELGRL